MESIRVNKQQLLEKLKENRNTHRDAFLEAQENYRKLVIQELDKMLEDARNGREIRRSITLPNPQDHTNDYDVIIGMLEFSLDTDIQLDEYQYRNYVLDKWDWKGAFMTSNSAYLSSATIQKLSL